MRLLFAWMVLAVVFSQGCAQEESTVLVVFHAGSLSMPFKELEGEFEARYPRVDVRREASGSTVAVKKVTELERKADVVACADYTVIEDLMFPTHADWYVKFARNEMVIAYTEKSRYGDEANQENWYEVLQRDGVEWGHSDPQQDPCGYRAVLVCQLAGRYYEKKGLAQRLRCSLKNVRPKAIELVVLLQKGELDYAFEYRSVAMQHGLRFIELPDEINLGREEQGELYEHARMQLVDGTVNKGEPIAYAVTIPRGAENKDMAIEFARMLLSDEGLKIMEKHGQPSMRPPVAKGIVNMPEKLRVLVREK